MALRPGSPAIDNGFDLVGFGDQRTFYRPVDLAIPNGANGDGSDIGAYEAQTETVDIGLRYYDGTTIVKIACEAAALNGSFTPQCRISKNGVTYGIILGATTSPSASKFRVQTSSGMKAIMKLP